MKKIIHLSMILLVVLILVSCQKNPAANQPEDSTSTGASADPSASATDAPAIVEEANSSTQDEVYESVGEGNDQMQFKMFIDPAPDVDPFPAKVSCGEVSSDVYTPSAGILLNNHCIITASDKRIIVVLPDGSRIYAGAGTTFQVNMDEKTSEIILTEGEVYTRVAPQTEGERFVVIAGDAALEAKGTEYGVHLKDELINVVVMDGIVYTHRCMMWKDHTCMKWNQLSSEKVSGNGYTGRIGEDNWNSALLGDPANWLTSNNLDMPLSSDEALAGVWWFASGDDDEYFDQYNFECSVEITESWIIGNLMNVDASYVWYDQLANQANESSAICSAFSQNCPVAEILITATPPSAPAVPSMSGGGTSGGPSGKFPEFDHSTCFSAYGSFWCYPKEGTVDISGSGEWNITAICAQYPGETFCSWIK